MSARPPIPMRRELRLDATPAQLWPLVSNTDRFNRSLGLPEVTQEGTDPESYAKKLSATLFGLTLKWREPPFEWSEGRYFRAVREFDTGPIARFEGGMELRADDKGGTRLLVDSTFTPRNALGEFLIKHATGKRALEDAVTMLQRFDASLKEGGAAFPTRRTCTAADAGSLAQKAAALHDAACNKKIAGILLQFAEHAYDDELSSVRPFEFADKRGLDRVQTLKVFLHATRAGLFDMSWQVLCPNCAGASKSEGSLAGLDKKAHCHGCQLEYGVDLDRSVELRFTVSPTVRRVEAHTFCVGNPARTPFAAMQLVARPGAPRRMEVDLPAESFKLRDLDGKRCLSLRPSANCPSEMRVDLATMEGELPFKPGTVQFLIQPRQDCSLVRLERESWKEKGATAALATSLQEFRDLFSSEVLAPGMEIAVRTVALLFTDLKGSTALYEQVGDASAYALVRDHFDYLFEIIRRRDGAVVKTIGDAVMAVFSKPTDAMAAAVEMQERVGELNAKLAPKPPVVLKIGVHDGPAIAINAGGVLDYFGTTVNIAARVQNESQGGDVVICDTMAEDSGVRALIAEKGLASERTTCVLKGLSDRFGLHRYRPEAKRA